MKGYTQVYTGNGKGKTTAAIGLCVRAAGAGLKVYIGQFVKLGDYSEIKVIRDRFSDAVTLEQFGVSGFISGNPGPEHIQAASQGLSRVRSILKSGRYDLVILEEINVATAMGLLSVENILKLITEKPGHVELVLTGRGADPKIIEAADLVTEMAEVKHYYAKGVKARAGIEK
jgi:cob(I)alamin adenosyltransferase